MMPQVVFNKAGDEEIAVVVTGLHPQCQRMPRRFRRLNQRFGLELVGEKVIAITLIHQYRQLLARIGNQHSGIPFAPAGALFTRVTERLSAPKGNPSD